MPPYSRRLPSRAVNHCASQPSRFGRIYLWNIGYVTLIPPMWEVTLKILLIPRPSVHTLGFIRCTYTVRGLFGSKFHKCKFVNFSVISYIPHVVWPTPDLPTHGKFWSPLPVAIFTASMRTATRLCWAISCYPFSLAVIVSRHPRSPVGSVEPTKHASMFPTTHGQNPSLVTPRGRVNTHNPPVAYCRQPDWQHHDLPPPAPLQVPITRNGPPYKAPWP